MIFILIPHFSFPHIAIDVSNSFTQLYVFVMVTLLSIPEYKELSCILVLEAHARDAHIRMQTSKRLDFDQTTSHANLQCSQPLELV
jgi:hypothetical protein